MELNHLPWTGTVLKDMGIRFEALSCQHDLRMIMVERIMVERIMVERTMVERIMVERIMVERTKKAENQHSRNLR